MSSCVLSAAREGGRATVEARRASGGSRKPRGQLKAVPASILSPSAPTATAQPASDQLAEVNLLLSAIAASLDLALSLDRACETRYRARMSLLCRAARPAKRRSLPSLLPTAISPKLDHLSTTSQRARTGLGGIGCAAVRASSGNGYAGSTPKRSGRTEARWTGRAEDSLLAEAAAPSWRLGTYEPVLESFFQADPSPAGGARRRSHTSTAWRAATATTDPSLSEGGLASPTTTNTDTPSYSTPERGSSPPHLAKSPRPALPSRRIPLRSFASVR